MAAAPGSRVPVLLLKTQSQSDGYEEHFAQANQYSITFVPVLEHRYNRQHLDDLGERIKQGAFFWGNADSSTRYGGLIFTSQRAVEAFASLLEDLRKTGSDIEKLFGAEIPIYVVGPATARAVAALRLPCAVRGELSGNGEVLADWILANHNMPRRFPLLFPVGEQRRDIIPKTLQSEVLPAEKRIGVEEVTVYETGEMASFSQDFDKALKHAKQQYLERQWAIVFSPTGCRAMLRSTGIIDCHGKLKESAVAERTVRIATIGPTTRAHLVKQFDFEPDACAEQPSPQGLVDAMEKADGVR